MMKVEGHRQSFRTVVRTPIKCGCADLLSGEMQGNMGILSADVMGKMQMWQSTNERMPIGLSLKVPLTVPPAVSTTHPPTTNYSLL